MDEKDFVSFETAKKLKAAGFDESCDHTIDCEFRLWKGKYRVMRNGDIYSPEGKKLKAWQRKDGYMSVTPYVDGIRYNKRVHQMVAETWIPNLEGHPMINHINGIKNDNRVENLEWCSASHNIKHAFDIGLKTATNARDVVICETGQHFASPRKMADAMGWDNRWTSHITAVCRQNGKVKRKTVHGYTIRHYTPTPLVKKLIDAGFNKYPKEDGGDVFFCYLCLAQKWLREEKGILLWAYPDRQPVDEDWTDDELTGEWRWDIDGKESESSGDTYPSYEAALSAGIDAALDLINNKTK